MGAAQRVPSCLSHLVAQGKLFDSEVARERRHVDVVPDVERAEIHSMYAQKGASGELLDRIVDSITANKDVWVAVMIAEEHHLVPIVDACTRPGS